MCTGLEGLISSTQHWKLAQVYWMILHISHSVRKQKHDTNECSASRILALRNIVMILEKKCKFAYLCYNKFLKCKLSIIIPSLKQLPPSGGAKLNWKTHWTIHCSHRAAWVSSLVMKTTAVFSLWILRFTGLQKSFNLDKVSLTNYGGGGREMSHEILSVLLEWHLLLTNGCQ